MERARDFDAGALRFLSGALGRHHEHSADALPTSRLVDDERGDPAPRSALIGDRNEEDGCETQESASLIGDKHVRTRIGKHRLEALQKAIGRHRMSELSEEPGDALNIPKLGRAYRHVVHDEDCASRDTGRGLGECSAMAPERLS